MSTEGGGSPELPLKFEDIVDMYYDKMRPPKTHGELSNFISQDQIPWNNGNRDPSGGVAEIQKMSPPTTGRCYCCH